MTRSTRPSGPRSGQARSTGSGQGPGDHYSYAAYADPEMARTFDEKRFGGPIGELVAGTQARVLANMIGRIHERDILDVGTGTGRAALLFARGGAYVTAVDASEEMLTIARQRAQEQRVKVRFQVGDVHALRFPDRGFDVVVCLRVLMHTPDWRRSLGELCRLARDRVVFDYPALVSAAALQAAARHAVHAAGGRVEAYRVFADRAVAAALARNGFRISDRHRQFVLPIALHKRLNSAAATARIEGALARAGLTRLLGSPVTVVAERCASS